MAKSLTKIHIIDQLKSSGLLPVFHHTHSKVLFQVMRIIYRGGMAVLEFKHVRDTRSFKAFAQLAELASEFPGLRLGVGTVLDAQSARHYIHLGAQFISSPFMHKETGEVCEANNIMWMPGCTSPQEVMEAIERKADAINIVQGNVPILEVLRQCTRDFPEMHFVPSAGIELHKNNIPSMFETGVLCIRLGESLFNKNDIMTNDWASMEINFYRIAKNIAQLKKSKAYNYGISV